MEKSSIKSGFVQRLIAQIILFFSSACATSLILIIPIAISAGPHGSYTALIIFSSILGGLFFYHLNRRLYALAAGIVAGVVVDLVDAYYFGDMPLFLYIFPNSIDGFVYGILMGLVFCFVTLLAIYVVKHEKYLKILACIAVVLIALPVANFAITRDIWDAVNKNRLGYVKNYLQKSGDVNFVRDIQWMSDLEHNFTLLMAAARAGRPDMVELLIKHGADVNAATSKNRTPLLFAAEKGNLKIAKLLIDHGANINGYATPANTSSSVNTILDQAIFYAHPDVVKLLLDNGAHANEISLDLAKRMLKNEGAINKKRAYKKIINLLSH